MSIEPWVEPQLLDERAASIVAGRVNAAGTTLDWARLPRLPRCERLPDRTRARHDRHHRRGRLTRASSRSPPAPTTTSTSTATPPPRAGSTTPRRRRPPTPTPAIAAATAPTSPRSRPATTTAPDAVSRTPPGFNYGLGIAPTGRLGATKIFNCAGNFDVTTSFTALRSAAYAAGARISNNSWGAAVGGAYNADAREFDFLVRDAQPGVAGQPADGRTCSRPATPARAPNTIGSPGTAKNVITVGASENIRPIGSTDGCGVTDAGANSARDIIDFSSRGPTDDGRLKPDVVAPGTHVTGAQPQTGAEYNGSGTCNPQFPAGSATLLAGLRHLAGGARGDRVRGSDPRLVPARDRRRYRRPLAGDDQGDHGQHRDRRGRRRRRRRRHRMPTSPTQVQGWGRINLKQRPRRHAPRVRRPGSADSAPAANRGARTLRGRQLGASRCKVTLA